MTYRELNDRYEALIARKNAVKPTRYNGIYERWTYPVLTREHIPPFWVFDPNPQTNPFMMQRLGVNAVFNSGALLLDGKFTLVARVEGADRKSFFAVAQSDSGVDGFRFWDEPVILPDTCKEETNVYDMRLTQHEDGFIYGVFCSESKDTASNDLSAAVAAAGIVRTKDLKTWERLPNLVTLRSPQQRNVCLHPEFVNGKYAFYTRPMDDFIETGSGGGRYCPRRDRRGTNDLRAQIPHHHREQKRGRGRAHQDGQGMDSYRPRRAQHRGGPAIRDLRLRHRPGRSRPGDCGARRLSHRPHGRGKDRGREQRGLYQRGHRRP